MSTPMGSKPKTICQLTPSEGEYNYLPAKSVLHPSFISETSVANTWVKVFRIRLEFRISMESQPQNAELRRL